MRDRPGWIEASWPAPAHILAGTTTRLGGVGQSPYDSFNLAQHVGDDNSTVCENRQRLLTRLQLPDEPVWLRQTHSNRVIRLPGSHNEDLADGAVTDQTGLVCAVLTADCLPLLLCDRQGQEVAAIHVGWRGFSKDIVLNAVSAFKKSPADLLAWLGPCISGQYYEVGEEVRTACQAIIPEAASAFTATRPGHWLADLAMLVRIRLTRAGLTSITGGDRCTFTEQDLFYSYRRDGETGRMASLIWIAHQAA